MARGPGEFSFLFTGSGCFLGGEDRLRGGVWKRCSKHKTFLKMSFSLHCRKGGVFKLHEFPEWSMGGGVRLEMVDDVVSMRGRLKDGEHCREGASSVAGNSIPASSSFM